MNELYNKIALFRSEKTSMSQIEPLMNDLRRKVAISDERFYVLLIAVTEAFNNAIVHGNKLNKEKIVEVKVISTSALITISIKDEGCGFNLEDIADPRAPENLLKENGRGVFLIRSLIDFVEYETCPKGTTIHMNFKI